MSEDESSDGAEGPPGDEMQALQEEAFKKLAALGDGSTSTVNAQMNSASTLIGDKNVWLCNSVVIVKNEFGTSDPGREKSLADDNSGNAISGRLPEVQPMTTPAIEHAPRPTVDPTQMDSSDTFLDARKLQAAIMDSIGTGERTSTDMGDKAGLPGGNLGMSSASNAGSLPYLDWNVATSSTATIVDQATNQPDISREMVWCGSLERHQVIEQQEPSVTQELPGTSQQPFSLPHQLSTDLSMVLDQDHALGKDWRMVAENLDYSSQEIGTFGRTNHPTKEVLGDACRSGNLTSIEQLQEIIKDMGRADALSVINSYNDEAGEHVFLSSPMCSTIPSEFRLSHVLEMEIAKHLDGDDTLGNDWRMLADKLKYSIIEIETFGRKNSPTKEVLSAACKSGRLKSIEQLSQLVEGMNRADVLSVIKMYQDNQGICAMAGPSTITVSPCAFRLSHGLTVALTRCLDNDDPLGKNWEMLADKLRYSINEIEIFGRKKHPTKQVLDAACKSGRLRSIKQLSKLFEKMERVDALSIVKSYQDNQQESHDKETLGPPETVHGGAKTRAPLVPRQTSLPTALDKLNATHGDPTVCGLRSWDGYNVAENSPQRRSLAMIGHQRRSLPGHLYGCATPPVNTAGPSGREPGIGRENLPFYARKIGQENKLQSLPLGGSSDEHLDARVFRSLSMRDSPEMDAMVSQQPSGPPVNNSQRAVDMADSSSKGGGGREKYHLNSPVQMEGDRVQSVPMSKSSGLWEDGGGLSRSLSMQDSSPPHRTFINQTSPTENSDQTKQTSISGIGRQSIDDVSSHCQLQIGVTGVSENNKGDQVKKEVSEQFSQRGFSQAKVENSSCKTGVNPPKQGLDGSSEVIDIPPYSPLRATEGGGSIVKPNSERCEMSAACSGVETPVDLNESAVTDASVDRWVEDLSKAETAPVIDDGDQETVSQDENKVRKRSLRKRSLCKLAANFKDKSPP